MDETHSRAAEGVPELQADAVGQAVPLGRPYEDGPEEGGEVRRRAIVLAVFSLLWLAPARIVAADNTDPETSGAFELRNGRYWNRLSTSERLAYLMGFSEAASVVVLTTTGSFEKFKEATNRYLGRATFGEILDGLDTLYAEPANRRISIIAGMIWYQHKAQGHTAAELQEELEKMRGGVDAK